MKSRTMATARRFLIALGIMLVMDAAIVGVATSPTAFADGGDLVAPDISPFDDDGKRTRTIMIYLDGASSEENGDGVSGDGADAKMSKFRERVPCVLVFHGMPAIARPTAKILVT